MRSGNTLENTESHGEQLYARTHSFEEEMRTILEVRGSKNKKTDLAKHIAYTAMASYENPTLVGSALRGGGQQDDGW